MLKVDLADGTTLTLPKPEGPGIQQLGIRSMYLNQRIDELETPTALELVDDIIFLILGFWKEQGVEKPFERLHLLVESDLLSFDNERYKALFHERVEADQELIATYKEGHGEEKARAKEKLKERGFIGARKITTYDKSFIRKAGIHV